MQRKTLSLLIMMFVLSCHLWLPDSFAQNVEMTPKSAQKYYEQGVAYGRQGQYADAVQALEQAIAMQPAYADAYNALAVVYHRQKHYQQALEQYLLAIEAEPHHVKARTNLAMVYYKQQQYQKAQQHLAKALQQDPNYQPAQKLFAKVKQKAEAEARRELERQRKEAERSLQQPVQQKTPIPVTPTPVASIQALLHSGTELVKAGELDAGIGKYRQALVQQPHSSEGQALLGMAYRMKYHLTGEIVWRQQEIAAFAKALQYDSHHSAALLGLGETLYEQGQIAKAASYFQQVLQYDPQHPAKDQLESILRQIR